MTAKPVTKVIDKSGKRRFTTWLDPELLKKLRFEARRSKIPQQRIIETVLMERYRPEYHEDRDAQFIQRLNGLDRRLQLLGRKSELVVETLALYVRMWLTATTDIPEKNRAEAIDQAQQRYERFLGSLNRRLKTGESVLGELGEELVVKGEDFEGGPAPEPGVGGGSDVPK